MGFLPPLRRIVGHMPKKRQTLLFSATFAPALQELIREVCHSPEKVDVAKNTPARTVAHSVYPVAQHLKVDLLLKVLEKSGKGATLIFTRTKHRADRVAERLEKAGLKVGVLHSNKSQSQRQRSLDGFRRGTVQVLVATDIAARGIDVAGVTHVINFDMPESATTYIHRIGRTGRAEKEGDAYTLVTPADMGTLREVERALGKPIERKVAEGFDYAIVATGASNSPSEMFRPERPRGRSGGSGSGRPFGRSAHSSDSRGPRSDAPRGEYRAPRSDAPRGEYRAPRSDAPRGEYRAPRSDAPRSENRAPRSDSPSSGSFQLRGPSGTTGGPSSSGPRRPSSSGPRSSGGRPPQRRSGGSSPR
jgi:ATP-dependent RNA helicase RhlE